MCNYSCSNDECNACCRLTFDIVGFEVKCNRKCSECSCNDCGEDKE